MKLVTIAVGGQPPRCYLLPRGVEVLAFFARRSRRTRL